jgi:hemolysin III
MTTSIPDPGHLTKPRLRGILHQWGAIFAAGAGMVLVAMAPAGRPRFGAAVFALTLCTLFAVSAFYHRVTWEPAARARMRRLDHASIFLLIAGTYTPLAIVGLPLGIGGTLLCWIWAGAFLGIAQSVFWVSAPKAVSAALAIAVGWMIVPYFGAVLAVLGGVAMTMLLVGGIAYTLGALAYAFKRPNPIPGVFAYHEVFHGLTLLAAVLHFAAVLSLMRGAT